jgi:hypothetical protein
VAQWHSGTVAQWLDDILVAAVSRWLAYILVAAVSQCQWLADVLATVAQWLDDILTAVAQSPQWLA